MGAVDEPSPSADAAAGVAGTAAAGPATAAKAAPQKHVEEVAAKAARSAEAGPKVEAKPAQPASGMTPLSPGPRSAPHTRPVAGPGQSPIGAPPAPPINKATTPGGDRPPPAGSAPPGPPRTGPPRASETRVKTLDPGSVAKVTTSANAQTIAQAQVDAAERRSSQAPAPVAKDARELKDAKLDALKAAQSQTTRPDEQPIIPTKKGPGSPDVAPPVAKRVAVDARPTVRAQLVIILEDGTDGAKLDLAAETSVLGREGADINFPHDDFLAPRHAEFFFKNGTLFLKPLKSTNGVFLQVHQEVELESGDVFRIGQQLLNFESLALVTAEQPVVETKDQTMRLGSPIPEGAWGRLGQLIAPDTMGSVYLLGGTEVYLGRERGDITFPGDGFVSGLHAVIAQRATRFFLKDLGSSNGTYLRLTKAMPVRRGMLVLAGQQLFRVEQ
ncbi:MAG: FHA domain-containing protein [Myxococcota bacterium]